MMKFRTEIKITDAPKNLSPERLAVLAGSCFSDNIGARMKQSGWPSVVNPCGVIYNPVSMAILFRLALMHPVMRREIVSSSIVSREGRYVSWFFSSSISGLSEEECVDNACESIERLGRGLESCQSLILTFGTSDVWLLAGTDRAVGNCHKYPASGFERRRVSVEETVETWKALITEIRERNPEIQVILTVSPRRYLSDGFAENSRQKAVLILACERLCRELHGVTYFPAFETLNDDLRDYRYYSKDMLHPSDTAIDYVWELFCGAYLDKDNLSLLADMERRMRKEVHKPIM